MKEYTAMSNAVTVTGNGKAPVNALTKFANEIARSPFDGTILRFNKGEWLSGTGDFPGRISIGTEMIVAIDSLKHGWVKWVDQKPVEVRMGLVVENFEAPPRGELSDPFEENWPKDDDGQPVDPWARTIHIVLRARTLADGANDEDGLYTFITTSAGGRRAIADLCKQAAKHLDQNPIIALEKGSYKNVKKRLNVEVPILKIVGWEQK
jgi:hypothetical protein